MICPFGREVGEPPQLDNCELYEHGCSCQFELLIYEDSPHIDDNQGLVRRWWDGLIGSDRDAVPDRREPR